MPRPTLHTEPVRLSGWAALVAGLALVAAFLWSTGADVRQMVGTLAVIAVTSIGGLEFARQHAYAPATVERKERLLDEVLSAEHALDGVTLDDVQGDELP